MLQVLICTLNAGISDIPNILLPEAEGVGYVVSMQYTEAHYLERIPEALRSRRDVTLSTIAGRGLSANRNNALAHATAEVCVIADDDVRYCDEYFDRVIATFEQNPRLDIAQFKIKATDGGCIKEYPDFCYTYPHVPKGMFIASIEMAVRVASVRERVWFDERFGLGSPHFICGEEDVFICDACRAGLTVSYFPYFIVEHPSESTGAHTYTDARVMQAKGAVQYYLHGASAWLRMFKFALTSAMARRGRFGLLLRNTFSGINYYRKVVRYESAVGRRCE